MKVLSALGGDCRIFRLRKHRLDSLFENPFNERPEGAIRFAANIRREAL